MASNSPEKPKDSTSHLHSNSSDDEGSPTESSSSQSSADPWSSSFQEKDSQPHHIVPAASTHVDLVNNARRPAPSFAGSSFRSPNSMGGVMPESMEEKMRKFHLSRQGTPSRPQIPMSVSSGPPVSGSSNFGAAMGGLPAGLHFPVNRRPLPHNAVSDSTIPKMSLKGGLSSRRGINLPGGLPGNQSPQGHPFNPIGITNQNRNQPQQPISMFNKFSEYVDTKNGTLRFAGKAVIHGQGIDFTSGSNFNISLDEVDTIEELGKGNYGTVYKVRHARPRIRRPGLGLAGNRLPSQTSNLYAFERGVISPESSSQGGSSTTGIIMAMKEIRLELDEAKFAAIIMELDILHRCVSPYIIDFYGAFFQEGAVYICIEYMDGGSIDKIYGDGIPENVLKKITFSTVKGLKTLKDDHNIIHRDVKPTNILVNTLGQIKICDFGVSGNLVASIAKTNIGCQSYMAPERISGGGVAQVGGGGGGTYSVQSDIWSMGLSIIECALGKYPYPPETYNNIFLQLSAIVEGEPPDLPEENFSSAARDFVRGCLNKIPKLRPTYTMLLQHAWLSELSQNCAPSEPKTGCKETEDEEVAEWVKQALERKSKKLAEASGKTASPKDTTSPSFTPAG
ncbi:putative polymyxin B resistance protein kinase/MAP kinase kinase PBS2 [Blumeria hordei DH14]|uniref:mitogen-activated protein kinase kinase n=1 Tax=Blumeria graminis f. sp. hordei (strain DH14) TaxID=546991 RepID=N1J5V5_BLUG1|nr:putative polymyxin B resistance protein kinase/MAP kinase kinase PBS2 [Blumeria hordei DH14]